MTAALEVGEWSAAHPGRTLSPGKTRYPLYRRLGGPQGRSGRAENLVPTGIRSQTVHPVTQSLYLLSYRAHLYIKYPLLFVRFYWNLNVRDRFFLRRIPKNQISWKSVQWQPSCSVRTDGRTDMTKLIFALRSFANAPKNDYGIFS